VIRDDSSPLISAAAVTNTCNLPGLADAVPMGTR
jgi:hypothetical protein